MYQRTHIIKVQITFTQSQNLFDCLIFQGTRHKAAAIIGHFVIEQKNKLPIVKGLK